MRSLVLGVAGAAALLSSANAADIYVPAPAGPGGYKDCCAFSWAGYYVGANIGGSWMHNDAALSIAPGKTALDNTGVIGGGQLGRNWQFGSIVVGVETDYAVRRLEANAAAVPGVTLTQKEDWVGTVRGRLGYAMGSWLIYGTAGFAYGDLTHHVSAGGGLSTNSQMGEGWAAGGGVEWAINPRWSIGAEYLHVDLGDTRIFGPGAFSTRFEDQSDIVRAKLNYHFQDYTPLK